MLLAAFLGLFVSVLGTVIHQTRVFEIPIGVGLALALVFFSALLLRRWAKKSAGWVFTAVVALSLTLFGQESPDVMIAATELGYAWSYGAIGIAALMVAFPRIPKDLWSTRV